jgi:hypothetical protein
LFPVNVNQWHFFFKYFQSVVISPLIIQILFNFTGDTPDPR